LPWSPKPSGQHKAASLESPDGVLLAGIGELCEFEQCEEFADAVSGLGRVAHFDFSVDAVAAPSADSFSDEEAGLDEVGHDPLHCAFGDSDHFGDISQTDVRVARDAKQHLRVVGDERPRLLVMRA